MSDNNLPHMPGVNHKTKIVFAHVPKTGGMSVMASLGMRGTHVSLVDTRERLGDELFMEYYRFGIIRDPYTRLRSYFRYLLTVRRDQLTRNRRHYRWMNGIHDLSSFKCFYRKLYYQYCELGFGRQKFAPHVMPQTHWVYDGDTLLTNDLIAYDDISTLPKLLKDRIGMDMNLPFVNKNREMPAWDDSDDCEEFRYVVEQMYSDDIILYNKIRDIPSMFLECP